MLLIVLFFFTFTPRVVFQCCHLGLCTQVLMLDVYPVARCRTCFVCSALEPFQPCSQIKEVELGSDQEVALCIVSPWTWIALACLHW